LSQKPVEKAVSLLSPNPRTGFLIATSLNTPNSKNYQISFSNVACRHFLFHPYLVSLIIPKVRDFPQL
jgi:hypothetical protein